MEIGEMKRMDNGPAAGAPQDQSLRGHFFTGKQASGVYRRKVKDYPWS